MRRDDGKCANRAILVRPDGGVAATYDKLHMFDVDLPTGERIRESASYDAGRPRGGGRGGRRQAGPDHLLRPALPGAAQRPGQGRRRGADRAGRLHPPTGAAHWEVLLRARAIETGAFVIAPAQGGSHEDGRATWGHSMAVSPWGEVMALADHDEPCVLMAELDLAAVAKARAAIPALRNERPFSRPQPIAAEVPANTRAA